MANGIPMIVSILYAGMIAVWAIGNFFQLAVYQLLLPEYPLRKCRKVCKQASLKPLVQKGSRSSIVFRGRQFFEHRRQSKREMMARNCVVRVNISFPPWRLIRVLSVRWLQRSWLWLDRSGRPPGVYRSGDRAWNARVVAVAAPQRSRPGDPCTER